jgi:hypothetical protein
LEVVGIIANRVGDSIIKEEVLMADLPELPDCLLEISVLSSSSDEDAIRDLLVAIDVIILLVKAWILSRLPYERSVSVAMMMPSLYLRAITAPPVTTGLVRWPIGSSSERTRVLI